MINETRTRTRWIGAPLAAATCSTAMLGGVTLAFDRASQMDWLAATPENLAALAPCERLAGPERARCVERTVTAVKDSAGRQTLALERLAAATEAR